MCVQAPTHMEAGCTGAHTHTRETQTPYLVGALVAHDGLTLVRTVLHEFADGRIVVSPIEPADERRRLIHQVLQGLVGKAELPFLFGVRHRLCWYGLVQVSYSFGTLVLVRVRTISHLCAS